MCLRLLCCLLVVNGLMAADVGQRLGDLTVERWIRAETANQARYRLVQFWASWSGPSLQVIPELNSLQQAYGGRLAIQALSHEPESALRSFLAAGGRLISYPVGIVSESGMRQLLGPQAAIPHALLVSGDGTVLWSGHPLLAKHVIAGLFDRRLDERTVMRIHALERQTFELLTQRQWDRAVARAKDILRLDPGHGFMLELVQRMELARKQQPDLYR